MVHAGSQLDALTVSHGSLWAGEDGRPLREVQRIDARTGQDHCHPVARVGAFDKGVVYRVPVS